MAPTGLSSTVRRKMSVGVLVLVIWQGISLFYPSYVFPGIVELLVATRTAVVDPAFGSFASNLVATFGRLAVGFLLALVAGCVLGVWMGLREEVEVFFRVWVVLGLSIPALAIAFALIMIIGVSELVPVLTAALVATPFVTLNVWEGAKNLDPELAEVATVFDANRYMRLRDVIVPQLLPYLFPSMYWGLIISWKVLFIAEVFGAGSGVGYMVNYWFTQQRIDMLLGWVLIPMLLVVLAQEGIRAIERRLITWQ